MIESTYQILEKIGYTHPLHPPLTHLVMGLVIGAFLFGLVAMLFNRETLAQTARHCIVLALIALPPTVIVGFMDWQHRFAGGWRFEIIMKIILAALLLVLLVMAIVLGLRSEGEAKQTLLLYTLCFVTVMGIGYLGGELVFGGKAPAAEIREGLAGEGALVFNQKCIVCHHADKTESKIGPGLKGLFQRDKLPVSGRPVTEDGVRAQLREPFRNMPAFPELPPEKVEALITFLKTL